MSTRGAGVVVVHFGDSRATIRCLRSVMDDSSPVDRRIVVVDNSTGLGAPVDLDPSQLEEVEVVAAPDNPGYGGGANRGVEALSRRGELSGWVILNNDVEVLPGFLDAALRALEPADVGAVGGPIRLGAPDGPLWYAGGGFRPLTGTVGQSRSPEDAALPRDVGFVPGTALAVRREAWGDVGGFDPGFFLYHEDLDLCLRLRRRGWLLRFEPAMAVVHHLGGATGSSRRSALYLEEMAATRLRPHTSRLYRVYLAVLHTPYVLLRAFAILLRHGRHGSGRARALLRGHRRALAGLWRRER